MKHPLQIVFFSLALVAAGQALWQNQRLPDKVAIHFGASGQADGWSSRRTQTVLHLGTVLFMTALFEGISFAQARLPAKLINLPHRAHWLAPERAAATRAWLVNAGLALGSTMMVFFLALFHLVYQANLEPAPRLSLAVWWLTGGLLAIVFGMLALLVARFGRKPAATVPCSCPRAKP